MNKENKNLIILLSSVIVVLLLVIISLGISGTNKEKTKNNVYSLNRTYETKEDDIEKKGIISTYREYQNLLNDLEIDETDQNEKITSSEFDKYDFIYFTVVVDECYEELEFNSVDISNEKATINFDVIIKCGVCSSYYNLYLISVEKGTSKNIDDVEIKYNIVADENCNWEVEKKPILYLYPEEEISVSVKLKNSDKIITSYPKYNDGWNVIAKPNGDLYDLNNKYYYALYWEEEITTNVDFKEGFYVTKDNAISFLEEKLAKVGLNAKERNEFIMYWLPILEDNKQSLVYFELTEERQLNNELIIKPKPDSLLRINMHIKKVDKEVQITEQKLPTFERKGFVAVEWGGTIHK